MLSVSTDLGSSEAALDTRPRNRMAIAQQIIPCSSALLMLSPSDRYPSVRTDGAHPAGTRVRIAKKLTKHSGASSIADVSEMQT